MQLTARAFTDALKTLQSDDELRKIQRYFKSGKGDYGEGDRFMGVKMGELFTLAKAYIKMPLPEVERLLESDIHELRAGAVSIMDFQARDKKTTPEQRKALYDLYLRRHDRINNWDLIDRSAQFVIGAYLSDKPRNILDKLARSKNMWNGVPPLSAPPTSSAKGKREIRSESPGSSAKTPKNWYRKPLAAGSVKQANKRLISFTPSWTSMPQHSRAPCSAMPSKNSVRRNANTTWHWPK